MPRLSALSTALLLLVLGVVAVSCGHAADSDLKGSLHAAAATISGNPIISLSALKAAVRTKHHSLRTMQGTTMPPMPNGTFPGGTLPPGFTLPTGATIPPGGTLPPGFTLPAGGDPLGSGAPGFENPCQSTEFNAALLALNTSCGTALSNFNLVFDGATNLQANQIVDGICGACEQKIREATQKYGMCLDINFWQAAQMAESLCGEFNGQRCGTIIANLATLDDCDRRSANNCTLSGKCRLQNTRCETIYTAEIIKSTCNPCVKNFFAAFNPNILAFLDGILCTQVKGTYCYPLINERFPDILAQDGPPTQQQLNGICPNDENRQCYVRMLQGIVAQDAQNHILQFQHCVHTNPDVTRVDSVCLPTYLDQVREQKTTDLLFRNICLKNGAGKFCVPFIKALTGTCFAGALGSSCPTGCQSNLTSLVSDMGCCVGSLEGVFSYRPALNLGDVPYHHRNGRAIVLPPAPTLAPVALPTSAPITPAANEVLVEHPTANIFARLVSGSCPVTGMADKLHVRCATESSFEVPKELKLFIAAKAGNNDWFFSLVAKALITDITVRLGLSEFDISKWAIVPDPSVVVQLTSFGNQPGMARARRRVKNLARTQKNSRSLRAMQSASGDQTATGVRFTFVLKGVNSQVTADASVEFDNAVTRRELQLPSVYRVVDDVCRQCVGPSGPLGSTTNSGGGSSGGSGGEQGGDQGGFRGPQQQVEDPACSAFLPRAEAIRELCQENTAFETLFGDNNHVEHLSEHQIDSALGEVCVSSCISGLNQLSRDPLASRCLGPDADSLLRLVTFTCIRDGSKYCGTEYARIGQELDCDHANETHCAADSRCEWRTERVNNQAISYCDVNFLGPHVSNAFCSPCMLQLPGVMGGETGYEIQKVQTLVCTRVDNLRCLPMVLPSIIAIETAKSNASDGDPVPFAFSSAHLNAHVCNNATARECFQTLFTQSFITDTVESAFSEYDRCPGSMEEHCVSSLFYRLHQAYQWSLLSESICTKNSAGTPCWGLAQTLQNHECLGTVLNGGTCSSSCDPVLSSVVNTMGCCAGTVHNVFSHAAPFDPAVAPQFAMETLGQQRVAQIYRSTSPTPLFTKLAACSSLSDINTTLRTRCALPPKTLSEEKYIKLRLSWAVVANITTASRRQSAASASLKDQLRAVLARDVARLLLVAEIDIVLASLVADPTVKVGNATGTRFIFKINASSSTPAATFDALKATNGIQLEGAQQSLKSICPKCVSNLPLVAQEGQGATLPPGAAALDLCLSEEYFAALDGLFAVCNSSTTAILSSEFTNVTNMNAQFATFCDGVCFQSFKAMFASRFNRCLPAEIADESKVFAVMCEKDASGSYCGTVMSALDQINCEDRPAASCTGSCVYDTATSTCQAAPTEAYLRTTCGGCITKFMGAFAGGTGSDAKEAALADLIMCSKAPDGSFCYPLLESGLAKVGNDLFTPAALNTLCDNLTMATCFRKVHTGLAGFRRKDAGDTFQRCAKANKATPSLVTEVCYRALVDELASVYFEEKLTSRMCVRNSDDTLCLSIMSQHEGHPCVEQPYTGLCNATCNTYLSNVVQQAGCCMGTIHDLLKTPSTISEFDIPRVNGTSIGSAGGTLAPRTEAPVTIPLGPHEEQLHDIGTGGLLPWGTCSSLSNMSNILRVQCAKRRASATVNRTLALGIAYNALAADPVLAKKILNNLLLDLANKLGVSVDDIIGQLKEDVTRTITVTTTNTTSRRRRLQTMAAASATTATVTVQTTSAAQTNAAGSQFDSLVASNSLTLPSTAAVVSTDCTSCVGSGGAASVQTAVESPTLAPTPGSGASAVGLLSLLLVSLATLLL